MTFRQLVSAVSLAPLSACTSVPTQPEHGYAAVDLAGKSVPAEALNLDVRQETIQKTICVPGYTASVRPSTTYTNGVKLKLMREQYIPEATAANFELDHHLALSLGGHPRNLDAPALGGRRWSEEKGPA